MNEISRSGSHTGQQMPKDTMQDQRSGRKLIHFPLLGIEETWEAQSTDTIAQVEVVEQAPSSLDPKEAAARDVLAHNSRNARHSLELLGLVLDDPGVMVSQRASLVRDFERAASRLANLVTQLAAERRSSKPVTNSEAFGSSPQRVGARSVGAVLNDCRRDLEATAGSGVAVYISFESRLPAVALTEADLKRALLNLVQNAAEAMPDGGTVRITARRALSRSAPAILLRVEDDGPGIPAHAIDHIFKAGFSSKREARAWTEECGLGLTIVHQLLENVGGTIRAASTRRKGTTFELRIPCPE